MYKTAVMHFEILELSIENFILLRYHPVKTRLKRLAIPSSVMLIPTFYVGANLQLSRTNSEIQSMRTTLNDCQIQLVWQDKTALRQLS